MSLFHPGDVDSVGEFEAEGTIPMSVQICLGCFRDGQDIDINRLTDPDAGINFFTEQDIVTKRHQCSGRANPIFRNVWQEKVFNCPESIYQKIESVTKPGPSREHPDMRARRREVHWPYTAEGSHQEDSE